MGEVARPETDGSDGLGGGKGSALQSLKGSHVEQGSENSVCKGPTIFGSVGFTVSVANACLCCSTEAAADNSNTCGRGCIPVKCSLQKLLAGWI